MFNSLPKEKKDKIGEFLAKALILIIVFLIFGFPVIKNIIEEKQKNDSTITNREMQEYNNWNNKQNQQEWEKSPFE